MRVTDWHNFGATSGIAWICMFAADKIVTGQTESDYLQFSVDMVINYGHLLAGHQIFLKLGYTARKKFLLSDQDFYQIIFKLLKRPLKYKAFLNIT